MKVISAQTGKDCPIEFVAEDTYGAYMYWCSQCGTLFEATVTNVPTERDTSLDCEIVER